MSENVHAHGMSENEPENRRSAALTLEAYIEREEAGRAAHPTMSEWFDEMRALDWGGVDSDELVAIIRAHRDRDEG